MNIHKKKPSKIIDGKEIASKIINTEKENIKKIISKNKLMKPFLCIINIGSNLISDIYIKKKIKISEKIGIKIKRIQLPYIYSEKKILKLIKKLNKNKKINAILVQMPLPNHINQEKIIESIDPKKDVDCFHPENIGLLFSNNSNFLPCTANGVINLIKELRINFNNLNAVIIGRSNMVSKPIAILLINYGVSVTICHSFTKNLYNFTRNADLLIVAAGKPYLINESHIKENVIIIDIGLNRSQDGKLIGDVDILKTNKKIKAITPVPGGVGPMTIAMLMKNIIKSSYSL